MRKLLKAAIRKLIIALIAIALMIALIRLFPVNMTASMPFGIYMRLPAWHIKEGDIVELDNPLEKEEAEELGVYVRHGLLKKVERIEADGRYYVLGEHPLSFDSRYFGPVEPEYIKCRLKPVLTTTELPSWLKGREDKK